MEIQHLKCTDCAAWSGYVYFHSYRWRLFKRVNTSEPKHLSMLSIGRALDKVPFSTKIILFFFLFQYKNMLRVPIRTASLLWVLVCLC